MSWFTAHFTREGPGVARDAPPKRGLALLADTIGRQWWELLQLNLLYVLFALPLVTLPAVHVAATRVAATMLDDRNVYLLRDFWEAFRAKFWRATALGLVCGTAFALSAYAAFIFLQAARANILLSLPFTISAATAIFVLLAAAQAFVLLALRDLPLLQLIRLALLGALARPLPVLGALAVVALLWVLHILFYPASIFMPAVLNFSFGALVVTFAVRQTALRLLALDADTPNLAGR